MSCSGSQEELTGKEADAKRDIGASPKERMDCKFRNDQLLEGAKGHLDDTFQTLVDRLELEMQKRLPFNIAFEVNE